MKLIFLLAVVAIVAISGCTQQSLTVPSTSPLKAGGAIPSITPEVGGAKSTATPSAGGASPQQTVVDQPRFGEYDGLPSISSSSVSPSNPGAQEIFRISITAQDDKALKQFSWESSKPLLQGQTGFYDCGLQKTCSVELNLSGTVEGEQKITVYAIDSSDQKAKSDFNLNVGPYRPPRSPSPSPTVSPSPTTTISTEECSSNSDCGRKQICSSKKCVDVQCTTDSHCTGCKRCSGNSCVSCGSGPYGCYC